MANKIVREIIHAKGIDIGIYTKDFENEYISLTDIAKYRNDNDPRFVIQNWMRNRNTVEFLAVWEELHNPDFNRVQFEAVRSEAGLNRFVMTPTKCFEQTNAIGIVSKAGRYGGGTYAHDRYFIAGIKNQKVATGNYNIRSIMQLVNFYEKNADRLEPVREKMEVEGMPYPQMKMIDMGFWQVGFDLDTNKGIKNVH